MCLKDLPLGKMTMSVEVPRRSSHRCRCELNQDLAAQIMLFWQIREGRSAVLTGI